MLKQDVVVHLLRLLDEAVELSHALYRSETSSSCLCNTLVNLILQRFQILFRVRISKETFSIVIAVDRIPAVARERMFVVSRTEPVDWNSPHIFL